MKSLIICLMATFITISGFSQKAKQNQTPVNADTSKVSVYSCSMHPEYISFTAAKCPVCGQNLSPKELRAAETVKLFTCPMHPNVVCTKTGKCPKCGMDMAEFKQKNKTEE